MKTKENIDIENLIEYLMEADPDHLQNIEEQFECKIKYKKEKHHSLQYTYYYEIDFGLEENFYVEIESGINNGDQVNHEEWGISSEPDSRTVEVLKDVIFSEEQFERWVIQNNIPDNIKPSRRAIAESLFIRHKDQLLKANKNQSYDNYVTGVGTIKTNEYYRNEYDHLAAKGVFWEFIYEEKEVDVNFV